jgi:hypothetical protein
MEKRKFYFIVLISIISMVSSCFLEKQKECGYECQYSLKILHHDPSTYLCQYELIDGDTLTESVSSRHQRRINLEKSLKQKAVNSCKNEILSYYGSILSEKQLNETSEILSSIQSKIVSNSWADVIVLESKELQTCNSNEVCIQMKIEIQPKEKIKKDIKPPEDENKKLLTSKRNIHPKKSRYDMIDQDFELLDLVNNVCILNYDSNNFSRLPVMIIEDDAPVYDWYKNGKKLRLLQMGEIYYILKDSYNYKKKFNNNYWFLLAKSKYEKTIDDKAIIGWISDDLIISNNQILNNSVIITDESIQIYNSRTNNNKMINSSIPIGSIFYAFDFFPRSSKNSFNRVLISAIPYIDQACRNMLIGWVDKKNVSLWNTNIACEFKKGTSMTIKDKNGKNIISNVSKKLPYFYNRYPIIEETDDSYKIGFFYDNKFGFDILFIIDGTRSMNRVFKEMIVAVKSIAMKINNKCILNNFEQPRFGLVFYRDKKMHKPLTIKNNFLYETNENYCCKEKEVFNMGNSIEFINYINNKIACDCDSTKLESVYRGIIEGLQDCNLEKWNNENTSRLRFVILIGDSGDNKRGNYSYEDVASQLKKYNIYKLIAIDVSNTKYKNSSFYDSIQPITNLVKSDIIKENPNSLSKEVIKQIYSFQSRVNQIREKMNKPSKEYNGEQECIFGNVVNYIEGWIKKSNSLKRYRLVTRTQIETALNYLTQLIDINNINSELFNRQIIKINKIIKIIPLTFFSDYSFQDIHNLNSKQRLDIVCMAKIQREILRACLNDKIVIQVNNNKDMCNFELKFNLDLNNDGIVVRDGVVRDRDIDRFFL